MDGLQILVVGGGIGGLTSAIALGQRGYKVEVIEKDPDWSVYGVGIIQQANVVRAVTALGVIDDYIEAGYGYDFVEIYTPDDRLAAKVPVKRLVDGYPGQLGIGRPALQKVLADRAQAEGAEIRLGVTVSTLDDDGTGVDAAFSDGSSGRYHAVIGADGLYSQMRELLFPDARKPKFAGQSVWRYNFPRPDDVVNMHAYEGTMGVGLVPLSRELVYMYLTTPESDSARYPREGIARAMREKLKDAPPRMAKLGEQITDDDGVVYRPLDWHFLEGNWYKGRAILIGDAAHGTTPHLGQGAGMAIEDSLVLAEELERRDTVDAAFAAFQERRYERCKYIVDASVAICRGQIGKGPLVNYPKATGEMIRVTSEPL